MENSVVDYQSCHRVR